jgi:hypothetical protein
MGEKPQRTEKHEAARNSLPEEAFTVFDALVEDYKFFATINHRSPFVSYAVLADMVRSGWRYVKSEDTRIRKDDS